MKLEEGKFYRDGLNNFVGPMERRKDREYPFLDKLTGNDYTKDGSYMAWRSSQRDLIEEVPGKVVTLYCGENGEWYASETPVSTDALKITFNDIDGKADPSSVRMELI